MKKRVLMLAMVITLGVVATGCGEKATESEAAVTPVAEEGTPEGEPEEIVTPSFDDMDLSKIVQLADYKGMELEKVISEVTQEAIDAEINSALMNAPNEDEDGVVDSGDTANIDYEGKIDGVAFDGGKDEGYNLEIGSNGFIPGFEDALIGAKKGETLDIDVTFPEEYSQSEDLAGKPAVFTVTINDITKPLEEPNDEWVAANTEYTTVDEYKEGIKKSIEEYNEQSAENEIASQAMSKLFEESEVTEYPQEAVDYGVQLYEQNVQQYADYQGQTIEEFVESQGMTMEQYNTEKEESAKGIAKQLLVLNAVAQAEGIKVGDETYKAELAKIVESQGMTEEELFEAYGQDNIEQNVVVICVQNLIMDNANIKEVKASDVAPEAELPEGHSADDGHDH